MTEERPLGRVVSIHVAVSGGAPMESTREAERVPVVEAMPHRSGLRAAIARGGCLAAGEVVET